MRLATFDVGFRHGDWLNVRALLPTHWSMAECCSPFFARSCCCLVCWSNANETDLFLSLSFLQRVLFSLMISYTYIFVFVFFFFVSFVRSFSQFVCFCVRCVWCCWLFIIVVCYASAAAVVVVIVVGFFAQQNCERILSVCIDVDLIFSQVRYCILT